MSTLSRAEERVMSIERELCQAMANVETMLGKTREEMLMASTWCDPRNARAAQRSLLVAKDNMRHVQSALEKLEKELTQ
jgi:hypothetical protein